MAETAAGDGVARERGVALRVLRRVDDGAYADRALAAEARRADLDPRSRAQATRLAYGAVPGFAAVAAPLPMWRKSFWTQALRLKLVPWV